MERKIEIGLEEIIRIIESVTITEEDFEYIFNDSQKAEEFVQLCISAKANNNTELIRYYLIQNEQYVNKENLMLILAKNYRYRIESHEEVIRQEESKIKTGQDRVRGFATIQEAKKQILQDEKKLREVIKISKNIDKVLTFFFYDEEKGEYTVDVVDSRVFIDGKTVSHSKQLKRIEKINKSFRDRNADDEMALTYILQLFKLEELQEVFITKEFGRDIIRKIVENKILKVENLSDKEFEKLRKSNKEEYRRILRKMEEIDFTSDIAREVINNVRYVDVDKLLLIAARRFEHALEKDVLNDEEALGIGAIVEIILENIENRKAKLSYENSDKDYSVENIEACLKRFTNHSYLSKQKMEEIKESINSGEKTLIEIDIEYIKIIFSEEELYTRAITNPETLIYVSKGLGWDSERIRAIIEDAYEKGTIQANKIKELEEVIDISNLINIEKLNKYYKLANSEEATQEDKKQYAKYVELYKEIVLTDKRDEEIEESYNSLIGFLIEEYSGEDYLNVLEDFFKNGLLSLEVLVEWNGEEIVTRLYDSNAITLDDIEKLIAKQKLSLQYLTNIYSKVINNPDMDTSERMEYLKKGFLEEKEIFDLYARNLIFINELEELAELGIVRKHKVDRIRQTIKKEKKEENAKIRLLHLSKLMKRNNSLYSETDGVQTQGYNFGSKGKRRIIDPNERQEYFRLFGAGIVPDTEKDIDEDSPFYNYEFYALPDESGEIGLNSVVIAERYYEDRETEEKFALDNATYFFRYDDLLVLSNLRKSEMTKERKNIVFTANHVMATEDRNGTWAASVLYAIVKTMLSNDLKGYTKEEQRKIVLDKLHEIYSDEEILEILDMGTQIDIGEYTYDIIDPENRALKRKEVKEIKEDEKSR